MKMFVALAAFLLPMVGPCLAQESKVSDDCAKAIPAELAMQLGKRYRNWKVADITDLTQEDRIVWQKTHPNVCPGVASGDFDGSKREQFMVLLNTRSKPASSQLIFVGAKSGGGYAFERVSLWPLYWSSAIHRLPPGQYSDSYEREKKFNLKTDVIALGVSGDKASGYFFYNGELRSIFLSD